MLTLIFAIRASEPPRAWRTTEKAGPDRVNVQNRSFRSKIDPHVNFSNFQAEKKFFISKNFLDVSMRKEQQQTGYGMGKYFLVDELIR